MGIRIHHIELVARLASGSHLFIPPLTFDRPAVGSAVHLAALIRSSGREAWVLAHPDWPREVIESWPDGIFIFPDNYGFQLEIRPETTWLWGLASPRQHSQELRNFLMGLQSIQVLDWTADRRRWFGDYDHQSQLLGGLTELSYTLSRDIWPVHHWDDTPLAEAFMAFVERYPICCRDAPLVHLMEQLGLPPARKPERPPLHHLEHRDDWALYVYRDLDEGQCEDIRLSMLQLYTSEKCKNLVTVIDKGQGRSEILTVHEDMEADLRTRSRLKKKLSRAPDGGHFLLRDPLAIFDHVLAPVEVQVVEKKKETVYEDVGFSTEEDEEDLVEAEATAEEPEEQKPPENQEEEVVSVTVEESPRQEKLVLEPWPQQTYTLTHFGFTCTDPQWETERDQRLEAMRELPPPEVDGDEEDDWEESALEWDSVQLIRRLKAIKLPPIILTQKDLVAAHLPLVVTTEDDLRSTFEARLRAFEMRELEKLEALLAEQEAIHAREQAEKEEAERLEQKRLESERKALQEAEQAQDQEKREAPPPPPLPVDEAKIEEEEKEEAEAAPPPPTTEESADEEEEANASPLGTDEEDEERLQALLEEEEDVQEQEDPSEREEDDSIEEEESPERSEEEVPDILHRDEWSVVEEEEENEEEQGYLLQEESYGSSSARDEGIEHPSYEMFLEEEEEDPEALLQELDPPEPDAQALLEELDPEGEEDRGAMEEGASQPANELHSDDANTAPHSDTEEPEAPQVQEEEPEAILKALDAVQASPDQIVHDHAQEEVEEQEVEEELPEEEQAQLTEDLLERFDQMVEWEDESLEEELDGPDGASAKEPAQEPPMEGEGAEELDGEAAPQQEDPEELEPEQPRGPAEVEPMEAAGEETDSEDITSSEIILGASPSEPDLTLEELPHRMDLSFGGNPDMPAPVDVPLSSLLPSEPEPEPEESETAEAAHHDHGPEVTLGRRGPTGYLNPYLWDGKNTLQDVVDEVRQPRQLAKGDVMTLILLAVGFAWIWINGVPFL